MLIFESNDCPTAERQVQTEREVAEDMGRQTDWDMLVEPGWFHEYVSKTIQLSSPLKAKFEKAAASLWPELYEAVDNGPKEDGRVRITWPTAVVLVTRQ